LFTGLPDQGRIGTAVTYQFQVAVFDPTGNPGRASPLSAEISPQASVDPVGLKTVIWTQNDASKDGPTPYGIADPRGFDGIKLQWTGTANRVYRGDSEEGPFCVILQVGSGNPTDRSVCADTTAFSTTQTTGLSGSNARFFLDKNVVAGQVYYYKVTAFNGSSEAAFSNVIRGVAMKHATQPLSPPRHLKAWAPMVQQVDSSWKAGPGVYLRWCPNPTDEGVTGYRIYRKQTPGGPYASTDKIAEIDDNPVDPVAGKCTMGSQRCEIRSTTCGTCTTPPCLCKSAACTIGPGGTCKTVDMYNLAYPQNNAWPGDQTQKYYYVVTAVRGTEESAYSNENVALPNYICDSTTLPTPCNPTSYIMRFDPDNQGDIACDDEMGSFQPQDEQLDSLAALVKDNGEPTPAEDRGSLIGDDHIAPYRVIGSKHGSPGGGGSANSRWLFYHRDHLGSPRVITDVSGTVVSQHHFMPFGDEKPMPTRVSSNTKMFTGHERDIESASSDNPDGLDYMMARYYSSSLGRFMEVDPSGRGVQPTNPQSWNRYVYARNNPLLLIDPDGEAAKIYINNQTTGQTRASINVANVVKGVQEKFDKAGAHATVKAGEPTAKELKRAARNGDTVHVVNLVDKPLASETDQTTYGHNSGVQNGVHLSTATHVGNLPQDNPATPGNEREAAAANNAAHEVGHDLLGPDHTPAGEPLDVMTDPQTDEQMTTPEEFNAKDAKKLQEKTK